VVYRVIVDETDRQRRYREDARVLGEIGAFLSRADVPRISVRLPSALARAALEAWQHEEEGGPDPESFEAAGDPASGGDARKHRPLRRAVGSR
jgi:hypothetical protein